MRDPSIPESRLERIASRLGVQSWFQLAFGVLAVFAVVGSITGAAFIQRTDQISDTLSMRIQPAMVQAYRLQASLLDQQTAARGYALTEDPGFLVPYSQGQEEQYAAMGRLEELLADHPELLSDARAVDAAGNAWREAYAEPLVASVADGTTGPVNGETALPARDAFEDVRTLFDAQNSELQTVLDRNLADRDRARDLRNGALITMVVGFILTGLAMVVLVHNLVAVPLSRLRKAAARVAMEENFHQHINPQGPKDIRALAVDVETMRGRIADALADSRRDQEQLAHQAEELRRSNTELEQFAYVASHDLQEPLRKVASFCQLLEKRYGDVLDERGAQYIEYAVDGAKRMQGLISDLLAFSRVGRVHDAYVPIDVGNALNKALSNLSTSLEESEARVERSGELPTITGDPTLLTMLWQNLVGNAVKFRHPDRAPVVKIDCEPVDAQGDVTRRWLISATDNGIGIGKEFADKIFVIFQRLHPREDYAGTGIGLALCKKIVEYHDGKIWLDTRHEGGTRLCFTLAETPRQSETSEALRAARSDAEETDRSPRA